MTIPVIIGITTPSTSPTSFVIPARAGFVEDHRPAVHHVLAAAQRDITRSIDAGAWAASAVVRLTWLIAGNFR
jgi:hypothetical protein